MNGSIILSVNGMLDNVNDTKLGWVESKNVPILKTNLWTKKEPIGICLW